MKPFLLALTVICLVCRVDAQRWVQLNPPASLFNNTILSTVVDRTGEVYAAGRSTDSSGRYVVAGLVNGGIWGEVGGTENLRASGVVYALALDSSNNLYAGGAFTDATGNYYIAKWDGSQWSALGSAGGVQTTGQVLCLAADKPGNVYAAGELIDSAGNYYVSKWDGNSWTRLGAGVNALAANGIIYSVLPDGAGNV